MKKSLFVSGVIFLIFLIFSCSTPIEEYKSKNDDGKEITDLLIRYTEAVNTGDSEKIVTLFHENGVYVALAGSITLTRDKMSEWKPEDWQAYGIRKIYDPEITINGNEAKVMAKVKYGNFHNCGNIHFGKRKR